MIVGWTAKAMVTDARRWAAFAQKAAEQGRGIAELQRRMQAQAEGLRRVDEAAKRLAGLRGGR